MGATIYLKEGTGNARCKLCKEPIKAGQIAIAFRGWNASGQVHSKPEDCSRAGR